MKLWLLLLPLCCLACDGPRASQATLRTQRAAWRSLPGAGQVEQPFVDRISRRGQAARGLYFSYNYVRKFGARGILKTLERTRTNAAVIDVKDARGRVALDTAVDALKPQVVERPLGFRRLLGQLRKRGVYTIARIACFADPQLSRREPARAIRNERTDEVWHSISTQGAWLDPYNRENHRVIVALAREAQAVGFEEIQLDYVRFPVDRATRWASYPAQAARPRYAVLRDLLRDADEALSIPLGVDVFGLTTLHEGDPSGLGQSLGDWTRHVEVISPMLYINGMRSWARGARHRAGMLIERLASTLRVRVGDGPVIRPYIQAFRQGADHWGPAFIAEQIEAAREAHADGFLFWHPGSDYAMVRRAARRMPGALLPFPIDERARARDAAYRTAQR